jgi:hypothetical protein
MISFTLYGGVAFYVTPDSIDYVRGLFPSEQSEQDKYPCCVLSIGGKEYFVRGLAQNVAAEIQDKNKTAEIQDENKTSRVEAQPHFGGRPLSRDGRPDRSPGHAL